MRLWTIHPKHLDAKGLTALWREGLLALNVLRGRTKGYRNHPQLERFRSTPAPISAIGLFLIEVWREAQRRGYRFDKTKLPACRRRLKITETEGQLLFEWNHLLKKLKKRDPARFRELKSIKIPRSNPIFRIVNGPIRRWEKGQ